MNEELLSISETAKLLGVCENTLRDWDIEEKFKAKRTVGGHRRYSLSQIREYLNKNDKVQEEDTLILKDVSQELIEKWEKRGYLADNLDKTEKRQLAILLENCESYRPFANGIFSTDQALWLTKNAWLRVKLKKIISVQPMTQPASLVFYSTPYDGGLRVDSEAIAAKTGLYEFKFFKNAKFDEIKEIYADTMALQIDNYIIKEYLYKMESNLDIFKLNKDLLDLFDYIVIAEEGLMRNYGENCDLDLSGCNLDVYKIENILNSNLEPIVYLGKYPNTLSSPAFCPYLLFNEVLLVGGVASVLYRFGWFKK